ncbi:sulfite exporter TauE/SafE family protein [Hydrogenophaga sp.]|jgi:sulfite exporter TauE/SafE|uniref:sulfite exporter TauE/SafE family protein n=2 Tax=Hydrogenophaga sp. TaxID=1904254 RepID=UPI002717ACBB|nr:sulfite exporter TauE/SafE family protein [Hydrogenophaga sp.]MDO9250331.1 sulfite exporter TauE/SafE family protein [Hydrogenophaga sp.]MDP2408315.1 sulfite exporter TauE/SafE family protein [Hydrogenophaga sp.]MDP3322838.1 sulfite exporter TauE/SafE family protein [Hydrogenophaga sp.]MDP3884275.1 sulfite exporter TauE/SafE family protein [Hydrogenophaga sp.]
MQTSMAITALFMGIVGGPHCVAMCGAACAGISRAAGARSTQALWSFQFSRMLGYSLFGAFAAGSVQGLAVLGTNTIAIRPVWTMFHAAAFLLGLALIWQARQPAWIDSLGQSLWRKARPVLTRLGPRAPIVLGVGWAFMPCGLLYSALLVASLSANVFEGAAIMALFSLGTSISLTAAPWLLLRLRGGQSGAWAIRLAGLALALTSGWALWMGLTNPTGLFCL